MDSHDIKIGTEGTFLPPFENGIKTAKRLDEIGYDSVWWADHLMGWIPESIFTPDLINVASFQKTPHFFYEAYTTIAVAAWNTEKLKLGTSVTETFRRHPAVLAQSFLTLDHISKGRIILGIGAGEGENVIPYGIEWNKPVSRLEEAIKIIKLLWENDGKVDFDGKFWKLKDAILAIGPYKDGEYPPIWIGAHGPKMLELTGRLGDGWLPANLDLNSYKKGLKIIRASAKKIGKNPDNITPALWCYAILDEDHEGCLKMLETPLIKCLGLVMSHEKFEQYGISHPLGENYKGLFDFIPTRIDRKTALEAIEKIPKKMCEDIFLYGTPDEIIGKIEEYAKVGLKHIVIQNATIFSDIKKIKTSFNCLKKVLNYFKG